MKRTIQILTTTFFVALVLASCTQKAVNTKLNPSLFKHLQQPNVLNLTLETDWKQLMQDKQSETARPALVRWQDDRGTQEIAAEISPRGHARRKICSFPPLKLKFTKENLEAMGLNPNYKGFKLVTHCLDGNDDIVLREYLIYKMLNELTDHSFQVQLAKVTYKSAQDSLETYAFLLENNDELADRLGGELMENKPCKPSAIDAYQYRIMMVFQYMIGNTDWSTANQHNIKLVDCPSKKRPVPVPYDFDYSGMVNAHYAIPPAKLPIKSVRERYFQWLGADPEELQEILPLFEAKKTALCKLINSFDLLPKESRADMLNYLESFYQDMPQGERLANQ